MFSKRSGLVLLSALLLASLTEAQSWTQLFPTDSTTSTARAGQSAVYDNVHNQMMFFGGYQGSYMNDVWALSSANGLGGSPTWTKLLPTGSTPSSRGYQSAIYDNMNNIMTIYGGTDGFDEKGDIWTLSTANGLEGTPAWTQLLPTGSAPSSRFDHTAVYDTTNNIMIIYGGRIYDDGTVYANDVWTLSNANGLDTTTPTWTQLTTTGGTAPIRYGHTAVYDNSNNRMIVFGGASSNNVLGYTNEIWVLTNANGLGGTPTWTRITTTGSSATTRDFHSAVYNATNNQMTIFGGNTFSTTNLFLNDVWVLSNANGLGGTPAWTQITTASSPPGRDEHSAVYDAPNNRMTIFGGVNDSSGNLNDIWVLDLNVVPVKDWMKYSTEVDDKRLRF